MANVLIAGSDHAGLTLKQELVGIAAELGYEVRDLGTHTSDSTDYPDYAHQVASAVAAGEGIGLLVCGSGIGMSMVANRHKGVRAAVCTDVFSAHVAREHNDANVLCMGQRVTGPGLAADILKAFLSASFEGGRHERRVNKFDLPEG